jgi:cytochrome P450
MAVATGQPRMPYERYLEMVDTFTSAGAATLPLAPKNPLPYRVQLKAIRDFGAGLEKLRDAGGPVTRIDLGPKWAAIPSLVVVASPQGAHDVLSRTDAFAERAETPVARELRRLLGDNLLVLPHQQWLPRRRTLQPVFTKQNVARFAEHIAEAAEELPRRWSDGAEIDLDTECRAMTLRALGRSVLGTDLDGRTSIVGPALRAGAKWAADRGFRPVNPPHWLPTPGQRRARSASTALHELAADILQACRADEGRDAPLVRALMQATDPQTGERLSDRAICDELVLFLLAGHDTTATTLTYALWTLGHRPELQERVAAEVGNLGGRRLTPEDLPRLRYTVQVLHEAMRLCPPAAAVGRAVLQDIDVDGHRLQAGAFAVVAIHAMHRDPTLWDDPLTFDPDRFNPERSKGRHRWQYLPFGGGPRSCIGDHFAMLESALVLATVLRRVEIASLEDDFPTATPLTVVAGAPIRVRVNRRSGASAGAVKPSCTHSQVLITAQEVVFGTAAAQGLSPARRPWLRRTLSAAIGLIRNPLPEPKPYRPRRESDYLQAARMSREMSRL